MTAIPCMCLIGVSTKSLERLESIAALGCPLTGTLLTSEAISDQHLNMKMQLQLYQVFPQKTYLLLAQYCLFLYFFYHPFYDNLPLGNKTACGTEQVLLSISATGCPYQSGSF